MTVRSKLLTLILLAVASCGLLTPVHASAAVAIPINGTFTDASGAAGHFVGTYNVQSFGVKNGGLVAIGTLVGTLTSSAGTILGTIANANTALPVTPATATCSILTLNIGAIHLNLLGLVVNLSPVNLNITAVAAPGNLLGNLLCAVANLLNGGIPDLGSLTTLLNRLLLAL